MLFPVISFVFLGVLSLSSQFADALTAAEIAALLHALSRSGQAAGDDFASLLQNLAPRVAALMPSFSSVRLSGRCVGLLTSHFGRSLFLCWVNA